MKHSVGEHETGASRPEETAFLEHPLSWGQKALWFIERLAPENTAYVIAGAVKVVGPLDRERLEAAFRQLVARHPALSTTFVERDGQPVARVQPGVEVALTLIDGRGDSEEQLTERIVAEAYRPFDLQAGPLVRLALIERGPGEDRLLLAIHHIVSDFWSLAVMISELASFYSGRGGELPANTRTFAEHVTHQEELLSGPEGEKLWAFWRQALAQRPEGLDLPADRPRPPVQSYRGSSLGFRLPTGVGDDLARLARHEKATLFMALLAAFELQLYRATGQRDLLVGTPTAGRRSQAVANLVGYFVNPVVLRVGIEGDPTFLELLAQVRSRSLDAFDHQDFPFPLLVERLEVERDPSRSPIFQVLFGLQKNRRGVDDGMAAIALGQAGAPLHLGDFHFESIELEQRSAQFDLSLQMAELGGELGGTLNWNAELFDRSTMERWAGHLGRILQAVVADPHLRLSEVPLLTEGERTQLLADWTATGELPPDHVPSGATLASLLLAQAARTPEAVALVSGEERLSYAELLARGQALAWRLADLGLGPEDRVGVCLERGTPLAVALWGVLLAGAAYVPLDPTYPRERLGWMLEDSGARWVLSGGGALGALAGLGGFEIVELDAGGAWPWSAGSGAGAAAPLRAALPENLAYLIYTSGSTGRPKAVAIEHQSAAALVAWSGLRFSDRELAAMLAATSVCFDLSVFELFVPWSRGGRVVLVADALALAGLPAAWEVATVNTVPSAMAVLVEGGKVPGSVTTVCLAGEPLTRHLADKVYALPGVERLWDLYGPSEDTTYSTENLVPRGVAGEPTIGRALAGSRAYVTDRWGRPVPVGIPGELRLAGRGLARGYLGRPALTAERFVPEPYGADLGAGEPGERQYTTGDLVRWRSDGELEFLGRIDHQVKVRGFRVELGEVEAALLAEPGVKEAVVVVRGAEEKRLVGYLAGEAPKDLDGGEWGERLKQGLGRTLPAYMVPSAIVVLGRLPRTPNGKVDRRSLPEPSWGEAAEGLVAPRTPAEEMLAELFAEVLKLPRVSVTDNFFRLGGHSLLATQLINRVQRLFGVELPVRKLFETPTVAGLATWLMAEGPYPAAGLERPMPAPTRGAGRAVRLSFAQERLWFLDRLIPGQPTYNMPAAVRLSGPLDARRFAGAVATIFGRHDVLRSRVVIERGLPLQRVDPGVTLPVAWIDLSGLAPKNAPEDARERAFALAGEEARQPFDLEAGPLMRLRAIRISADEHLAVVNFHHVACDGWSIGVFFDELSAFYAPEGRPEPPAPALSYAEHAAWQRQGADRPEVAQALAYWRQTLAGAPGLIDLPLDRPRRADRSSLGATVPFRLAPEAAASLAEAAKDRDATLFMALFAGFATLLSRLTHGHDLVVGVPVAGRGRPETEGAIGLYVNTLPIRLAFGSNPTFTEILGLAREALLAGIAHQSAPFEKLVADANPGRDLTHSPLFQVLLVLEGTPFGRMPLGDLEAERLLVHNGRAKFDLTLTLAGGEQGLEGIFELDADLLDRATVERWGGHLQRILRAVAAQPDLRLSDVPLLSEAEKAELLAGGIGPGELPAPGATLASLLVAQAAATPEAVALVAASPGAESERLSYAELARRAGELAGRLASLGIGPEDRVGVCLERQTPLAVALWGVLLSGAAYVPLDPTYPRERLAWMLEDSGARLVLTGGGAGAALDGLEVGRRVELDEAGRWPGGPAPVAPALTREPLPGNLAYLIYTSGSTGRPKAVAIEHHNAAALVAWSEQRFTAGELSAMLAATSVCFDLSAFELFVPWSRGGRVVLVSDALALAELPGAWEVATVNAVPSAMAALVAGGHLPASVATVCLAGEPLSRALARAAYGAARVERLWNLYGPSEDTTYSTESLVPRSEDGEPTIGRPLAGTRSLVTDRWGGLVPLGVPGELRLAGRGLARGYLGRPALTAERFVPEPFGGGAGARQYRTGDLVRWRSDGDLEFLGRIDHQVKVRGFRVELGEIESALAAQPGVTEAVVVLRGGEEKRLVGYVGGEPTEPDWGERLTATLARTLPAYLVPSAVVVLPRLPRTPNGKVDRRNLPEPDWGGAAGEGYLAPRNEVEQVVAELFAEVLKVPRVSVSDNFFRLGGHSLLATQLIHRLEETLGVALPLRQVFETPTVAGLAALAAERVTVPDLPRLRPRRGAGESVLSFAQERLWFLEQLEPGRAAYHLAVRLALGGELSVGGLGRALEALVRRHEVLRTAYTATGEGVVQRVLAAPPTRSLPVVDLSGVAQPGAEARRLSSREARLPFDLVRGRMLRTSLLRLGATEHELLATVHHIAADGSSTAIFLDELARLYAGQALPPLAIQYGDFAVWQRRWLAGEVLAAQLAYWREALAGAPEVLDLPADRPRSEVEASGAGAVSLELGADVGERLRSLAHASGATPFMVLLAGFGTLLGRWSGERDLVIGSPIANRRQAGTEGLIGFFVNTLALRVRLAGNPSLASLVGQVRETTLGAYAHQDLPFERLVEELAPERRLGVSPLFQVMLALQQGAAGGLELNGIEGRLVREEPTQAMFELTLEVEEAEHGGFTGRLEYATERFDPATVERLARRFERLLEAALEASERPLGSFSLLSPQERSELALDWLGTPAVEAPRLAPEWVSAQAAATPDAVAIEGAGEAFSYGWLEARASGFGRRLADLGVEPEEAVAVLLPPGPELVVALLGIWKAGAAYLPWSADQPAARRAGMAEDAGVRFGVGGPVAGLADVGLGDDGLRWLTVAVQGPEPLALESWARPLDADQLAYVLFTSGSTGRPKGTLLAHGGLARYVAWVVSLLRARPIRSLLLTAPSFDPSLAEILPALVSGGRLVVAEPGEEASKQGLVARLTRHRVTQLELVPSLLAPLLEAPGLSGLDALDVVFCGGEALPGDLAGQFVATSRARLINSYGPTEATIDAAFHEVAGAPQGPPPIGRARPGSLLAVLDAWWQPAPLGVPGELWIGGSGLARGYLGRAALTAERFVPDALSGQPGARLYRTGDRVRRRPDGELEILGRLDFQVKLRGIRVELGEVEAALLALPGAREAVAVVCLVDGDQRLVGYVAADPAVLEPDAARERLAARDALAARLPAAMVPSALVVLERLPRTANGKVDRKGLPEPEWRGAGEEDHAAPRTEAEELLAELFAEVLRVPRVSIHDNFFRLGGHSLLAARLIHRLEEALGVVLPLRQVFETPTVADLAALVEQRAPAPDLPRLRPRRGAGEPVLSFAQERLWFLDRLAPGQPTYNMPAAVRLTGRLDVAAFTRAVSEVVARHEVLRTRFVARDGVPHEVVEPPRPFAVPVVDLSPSGALSPGLAPQAHELAVADARRPFDLERGPLLRAFLVRVAEDEHLFCLDLHHIVCDGWSIGVLVAEIGALYPAFLLGRPSPLPPLPIQYADFAAWQRRTLAGERLAADLVAWKERLAGAPERLELPADRPSPATRTPRGGVITRRVPAALLGRVEALGAAAGGTSFMVLATAFATLLARVSGQREVVLGVPMAGRQRLETEPLVGLFVNTVPLFTRLGPGTSFNELVAEMRGTVLDAFSRQDVPFEKLIDELGLARNLGTTPLVQVMFALQNHPMGTLALPGLELAVEPLDTGTAKFDLTLSLSPEEGGLSALWVYRRDLFDATTVERLVRSFEAMLGGMAANPAEAWDRQALLAPAERRQLAEWNDAPVTWPQEGRVHRLFAEQVARTPEAIAVEAEGEAWSYAALAARVDALGAVLEALGVGPETLVGLLSLRRFDLVAGVLAVLSRGAAYVPLDPAYPAERLAFMLADSGSRVVLAEERWRHLVPAAGHCMVSLDEAWPPPEEPLPEPAIDPDNVAYVIYTSGSTGTPKAVVVQHRAMINRVRFHAASYLAPGERVLQKTSISFDVSVVEVLATVISGAVLVLVTPGQEQDLDALATLMAERQVAHISFPPSQLNLLLERPVFRALYGLKVVVTGGETVPAELADRFTATLPAALDNRYGPTETTVSVLSWRCRPGRPERVLPIGRPIADARVWIVDRRLELVPLGVAGEIAIGGLCVARGYWRRPGRTAESFFPDPFAEEAGARLYRSGDLARRRSDGAIEFLGRLDAQVKIRGFRVELGEIETALSRHPAVGALVVLARADEQSRTQRLVAWVVPAAGARRDGLEAELRDFLAGELPHYMVPGAFVLLDSLPLTPNGKVDRRRLPEPEGASEGQAYVPPRTRVEERLAGLFAGVLGRERVGALDDFFELGGHSLLATQLVARIRDAFGIELPLARLFETPTVAGLAASLGAPAEAGTVPAKDAGPTAGPTGEEAVLSFGQERMWFLDRLEPGNAAYNLGAAVRLSGELRTAALAGTLSAIAARHEVLRTTFVQRGGRLSPKVAPPAAQPLPTIDLSALEPAEREALALVLADREGARAFDLERGPLMRGVLARLEDREHLLIVHLHHVASDGWSMGVLVKEIAAFYGAALSGAPAALPALPVQYADYARWQRRTLSGERLGELLAFWRQALAGAPSELALPTDRPRPALASPAAGYLWVTLPGELLRPLSSLERRTGSTRFMTLLAALDLVLARWSGQRDVVVGAPIAGRQATELEGLIGFFVNSLALRVRLDEAASFADLLGEVGRVTLAAYAHQELPFEKLVEELQPTRNLASTPLFQVMLALQNVPFSRAELPGLILSRLDMHSGAAKFDLTLPLAEIEGGGLAGELEYRRELFDPATIERLVGHLATALAWAGAHPDEPLSRLALISPAEAEQLAAWNQTRRPFPDAAPLPVLIERQVARTPEAVALVFEDQAWSFEHLDQQASALADELVARGVGPGVNVGVFAERSLELVLALHAVGKAGGAYVPLDPDLPRERLVGMIEDARPAVVLATPGLEGSEALAGLPSVIPARAASPKWLAPREGASPKWLAPRADLDAPAYVIFTSGSTGRPKGAVNHHRGVVNRLLWIEAELPLSPGARLLQKTPFSFDVSVGELFWPLVTGRTLVIARPGGHREPQYLAGVIAERQITNVHFVPSMLEAFLELPDLSGCASLERVLASGEALPAALAARFHERIEADLVNLYGPTEAAVEVTWWRCLRGDPRPSVPIGRPVANTRLHVVDRLLRPTPLGVPGELLLAGVQVAAGYLDRPALTAEKFLPDGFAGGEPGARVYRTGDLVRLRPGRGGEPGGEVEFLGRIDFQVKIRGLRIELGEIEAALLAQPQVRAAVVVARPGGGGPGGSGAAGSGDLALVAYFVPVDEGLTGCLAAGDVPPPEALGAYLAPVLAALGQRLPAHMVPTVLVPMLQLPVGPTGKVDRKALPDPAAVLGRRERPFEAPSTPVEEVLAGIFQEVLGVERVGVHDSFFELGGHSLRATQVQLRVNSAFGIDLPLRRLFEAPTVAGLAVAVAELLLGGDDIDLAALLAELEDEELAAPAPLAAAPSAETERLEARGEQTGPLSFGQNRLWFLSRLEPENPAYNLSVGVRLSGALDVAALAGSLAAVVARHEILRTVYCERDGEALQQVLPPHRPPLPVVDLGGLPQGLVEERALLLVRERIGFPFDLDRGPVLRGVLLRNAPGEHLLILEMHHVASDGWSMGILVREIATLYGAALATAPGAPPPSVLPPLPVQYLDFAHWQRRALSGPRLAELLAWWRQALAEAPAQLELPTDRPRPAVASLRAVKHPVLIAGGGLAGLTRLERQSGATRFMTLLAALGVTLGRFSGQQRVVVGAPIAGRQHTEVESLIGFFVNTLALAVRVDEKASFAALLREVAQLTLDAFAHQDLPFEKLVEELQPQRNPATTPIFQVMLALQNMPFSRAELPGLLLTPYQVPTGAAKYDLTLGLGETAEGVAGVIEYRSELFDVATIERLLAHLELVLTGAAAEPERLLAELPRLAAAEQAQLASWNSFSLDFSGRPAQHEQFAAHAAARPEALAIADGEARWSYGELEARACRLARWLHRQGVGRETVVVVVCERSAELVLAELAAWKTGAAYLPIDPANPPERLAAVVEDAQTPVVLTQSHLLAQLVDCGRPVLALDDPAGPWWQESQELFSMAVDLDQVAILIYTSGSTGTPKGAALAHRGVVGLCTWHVVTHGVTAADRASMVAGPGFDASAWDVWPHLASGASVWVPPAGSVLDPPRLAAWLAEARITVCFLPTPLAELMVAGEPGWGGWPDLRVLTSGGDRLRVRPEAPGRVLHNQYGPSETTIVVTDEPVGREPLPGDEGRPLPIGRPMPNHSMWVVDRQGRLLPLGAPGELLIGGPGLARGYHRRPRLTAERFLPDGFSGRAGARLYRTGDLVRWLPDGRLDFLGRIDFQVKIRGQRVELGEIEACLTACPEVAAATVATWPGAGGSLSLAAYVVPREAGRPPAEWLPAVKSALSRRLPPHMVPADLVPMEALPQTPNGKVDRRALPAPFSVRAAGKPERVPPRTALEAKVAAIFGEVLGRPELEAQIGITDDFFSLGGHSLLATRLASRVRDALGVELELRRIFAHPSVAALAAEIEGSQASQGAALEASAETEGPLSFGQERLWFLSRLEPESPAYNLGAAVHLAGPLGVCALAATLEQVVARHAVLRTVFEQRGEEMRQRILPGRSVPLPVVDLSGLAGDRRELLARQLARREATRPFALERVPVVRFLLLRLAADAHVLSAQMHHIASDGWSVGILIEEIGALYGGERSLPALPVQYLDYARWQRRTLTPERVGELVAYWRKVLEGAPAHLDLATDRPRPALASPASAALPVRIAAGRLEPLAALERRLGATRFMTLLTAFDVVLSRWSGQRTVVVGTPIAGRRHTELEGLIGFFVNTLALPVRVDEELSFAGLLEAVAGSTLAAYAHQDLPFERLVEELQPRRSLATTPIFQALLALQNTPAAAVRLPGLELTPFETGSLAAKFDLNLALAESAEGLAGGLEYRCELWDAATLQRLLGHFERVLEVAAQAPERSLAGLSLLSEAEEAQLAAWNRTARPYPEAAPLAELIERQVDRTPDAVALAFEHEQWSYRWLDERANALARDLVGRGVGPGGTVGVLAERSLELVLALVATEKAGGAYVPLDPEYPEARLAAMIEDARPVAVLVSPSLEGSPVLEDLPVVIPATAGIQGGRGDTKMDPRFRGDDGRSPKRLAPRADLDSPAYVIFTSGSTGKPKGTVNSHRGIANRLLWMQETFQLGPGDRVLQKTPASFDVSVWEFFWPLITGAKLVVAAPGGHRDPAYLLRTLAERQVTTLHFVPSMLAALLDASDLSGLASVRRVMASGEALPAELVARFHRRAPRGEGEGPELHNLYGPTEAAVDVTWWPCVRGDRRPVVPIGRPVANTRLHVVDRRLRPTPLGVPGELLLAGVQVGGGYQGRPALTAERFLPDGFGQGASRGEPGARVYRTGDLARFLPGGEVEFLGRLDFQVKIRGQRLELGEIEATLAACPGVAAAAVVAWPAQGGDLTLAAYLAPADPTEPEAEWLAAVQAALSRKLPAHMVPAAWMVLPVLPLSANGKLDRKALPEPGSTPAAERPYEPPRTDVEETLAGIFADVLGVDRVGIHDHFFERGGHSLKASQVQLRMVATFGVEVPLRRIFESPTVAGLALAVAEGLLGAEGEEDLAALLAELEE